MKLETHSSALTECLRLIHNGWFVQVVLVGFRQLCKSISDAIRSPLMNVLQELPLSQLTDHECGHLTILSHDEPGHQAA